MFLDLILPPQSRRWSNRRSRCIRPAACPPTLCDRSRRGRAQRRASSPARRRKHGLKIFAMTKQMGRNGSFCRAVARGGIDKAVAVDMECARACRRAGLRHRPSRPSRADPARRGRRGGGDGAGLLDRVQRRRRRAEASAASVEARPHADDCSPASSRRATRSIAATRAALRRPTSSPSPTPSTRCPACASPASPSFPDAAVRRRKRAR